MKAFLKEAYSGALAEALIAPASREELPLRKDGWQFTWRNLGKTEGASFFKIYRLEQPNEVEGVVMLTLLFEEMLFMNNIEVAPQNLGSSGRFDRVAGCLLAYACYKSFEWGKGTYNGFLSFDSKTELIPFYQEKYGATHAMGQKMFFDPKAGKALMNEYLNLSH